MHAHWDVTRQVAIKAELGLLDIVIFQSDDAKPEGLAAYPGYRVHSAESRIYS
jgi:hypothetical protein